jgi:hypothetical protein
MKRIFAVASLVLFCFPALAGHIYGTLRQGGKTLAAGQKVELRDCGELKPSETDHNGAYRFFVRMNGACTLVVTFGGKEYQAQVYSYPQPTAYDFDLPSDGSRSMTRR